VASKRTLGLVPSCSSEQSGLPFMCFTPQSGIVSHFSAKLVLNETDAFQLHIHIALCCSVNASD